MNSQTITELFNNYYGGGGDYEESYESVVG